MPVLYSTLSDAVRQSDITALAQRAHCTESVRFNTLVRPTQGLQSPSALLIMCPAEQH